MKPAFIGKEERKAAFPVARPPLRIALAGYGVVGQALAAKLDGDPDFELVAILVRDAARARAVEPPVAPTTDRRAFLAIPADIIVEVTSCDLTGALVSEHALTHGVHVVSASKRVVSTCRTLLAEAAETGGGRLLHSAAVGGGAPVLETVAEARGRGDVVAVDGILNGTVNYILERLGRGAGFREALAEARLAGFAEENPVEDLSGADAAAKLRLIAAEAWGCDPAEVDVAAEPLDEAAVERIAASGERWIQHARVERREGRIVAEVSLRPRQTVATLPHVPDEWNCAAIRLDDGTVFRCRGRGAGGAPTAEAILSDLHRLLEAQADAPLRSVSC